MAQDSTTALREQLVEAVQRLLQAGVMSHSKHGNMSARLPGTEQMLLTSTGLHTSLSGADIPIVTFDGEVISGTLDPTTREIIGMHSSVYRARAEANSVMHTHSPHVTSFALAHQSLPCAYEALLRFGITVDIPVADWAPRGSRESVTNIIDQVTKHPDAPAVLLANHGLLAFGRDPLMTAFLIISMEEAAGMTLEARKLGGEQGFPDGALEKEREHMRQFGSLR
ncbi:MAG TPA: class II aldolase/adducin family protein [Ktedonobacteraceae bacterium]|nr:class II aldolase/adducin family protein [Ktedonobacteraceae bacterium]